MSPGAVWGPSLNDIVKKAPTLRVVLYILIGLSRIYNESCFFFQVRQLENLKDFGECVITLQECVVKKFLQGFMAPKQKKKKKQTGDESGKCEEVDEEKKLAEEARVSVRACNRVLCSYPS